MNILTKIVLLATLAVLGIGGVIGGLVCRKSAVNKQKQSHKRQSKKPMRTSPQVTAFTALAVGSGIWTLIFGIWGGYVVLSHALPDSDYIKTDIVIEENGYQDEQFTANGVVYEALPLSANDLVCKNLATAVFTYKTEGFLNGYLTGNYYRIENEKGFDLVWNGVDRLFAPVSEREAILAYYFDEAIVWKYYDWANAEWDEDPEGVIISQEAAGAMQAYLMLNVDSLPIEKVIPEEYETIAVEGKSSDGIVTYDYWFVVMEGKVYVQLDSATTNDQREELTLAALPDEIGAPLAKLAE